MKESPTIFLSAAEASGDLHAAGLIQAIRRRVPGARFVGVAGEKMAAAGCEVIEDMTRQASMLGGPLLRLGYYWRAVRRIGKAIRRLRPDVHVPVDSPALNWHLAKAAKSVGSPVMYYIAPQVWAWAPWRVKKLRCLTDRVACILPFEEAYLRQRGVNATYVGHPLMDGLPPRPAMLPDLVEAAREGTWRVAIVPGSRPGEIRGHTPAMLAAAAAIRARWPKARCTLTARDEAAANLIRSMATKSGFEIAIGRTREVLAESTFAVVASGTVTLEVAHFGVPMVIVYRAGRLGYWTIGRWLIRTPHLSLVNILAGRRIVPELMPWHGNTRQLTDAVLGMMGNPAALTEARRNLLAVVEPLHATSRAPAADRAAEIVLDVLQQRT